ncbi:MAG: hypothetical protein K0R67_3465 [Paenibacillus sp.]|nr:hypothetical protein [Paenibacillus sp.]
MTGGTYSQYEDNELITRGLCIIRVRALEHGPLFVCLSDMGIRAEKISEELKNFLRYCYM